MQTSYPVAPGIARAGQIAFAGGPIHVDSKIVSATGTIKAGRFVVRDADDRKVKVVAATGDVTGGDCGVALFDETKEPVVDSAYVPTGPEFKVGESIPVLRSGYVYVYCETACVKGVAPFVRFTTNTTLIAGDVRNDADTARAVQHPTAKFDQTLSAAGLVRIKLW
jgi:hypothetical protein